MEIIEKIIGDTTITKEKYEAYNNVRKSGIVNMFDVGTVQVISGLLKNEVFAIMENYGELEKLFKVVK